MIKYLAFICLMGSRLVSTLAPPDLFPLKYVTIPMMGDALVAQVEKSLWAAVLPVDSQDAVAIFVSEGVSGALGGLAAKGISLVDGNKNNKDSGLVSAGASGVYFGVTGAVRSLLEIGGLSPIAVNILALFLAVSASEIIKFRSRTIPQQRTRVKGGPTMYDLMKFKQPSMFDLMKFAKTEKIAAEPRMPMLGEVTRVELVADTTKWITVTLLCNVLFARKEVPLDAALKIGALSGLISQLVRENKDKELEEISTSLENSQRKKWDRRRKGKPDFTLTRLARSCVEGAAQLLTYQASRQYVMQVSPYFNAVASGADPFALEPGMAPGITLFSSSLWEPTGDLTIMSLFETVHSNPLGW